MLVRYSSRVVAPMHRSSPRESMGLRRFPASMEPPVAPAPTMVWISSMKRTTPPSLSVTSLTTALRRSSNSPRNFAPAMSAPMSRDIRRRPCREVGTSPATMRCASPSTTAVLPTPGSPMSTGLFLERRDKICTARRISSSRPITGSSFPSRACWVRSTAYLARASYFPSGFWSSTVVEPRIALAASSNFSRVSPNCASACAPKFSSPVNSTRRCSTEMYESPHLVLSLRARSTRASRLRPRTCALSPETLGFARSTTAARSRRRETSAPACWMMRRARPLRCSRITLKRCSVSTIWCPNSLASSGAPMMACQPFSVKSPWEILPLARTSTPPLRSAEYLRDAESKAAGAPGVKDEARRAPATEPRRPAERDAAPEGPVAARIKMPPRDEEAFLAEVGRATRAAEPAAACVAIECIARCR
mmetsp:Transcript_33861/g.107501  ORF Transcript_33861/g.107501 Transcript_33861/m.107501 type:complete len:420 (-) Transcript_33861:46-1305(-)